MKKQRVVCIPPATREPGSIYDCIPLVPETHLLFAGPLACARHGLLSGAKYYEKGRISYLLTDAREAGDGSYLDKITACAEEIATDPSSPKALCILLCCSDVILSTDTALLQKKIEGRIHIPVRFLTVNRLNMYAKGDRPLMFPTQPEVICSFLRPPEKKRRAVNLIGSLVPPDRNDLIFRSLESAGFQVRTLCGQTSFEAFQTLSESSLNLALTPDAETVCRGMEKSFGLPWLPYESGYHLKTLAAHCRAVSDFLGIPILFQAEMDEANRLLEEISSLLSGSDVIINGGMMKAPWSLARELVSRNVSIDTLFYTRFSGQEPEHRAALEKSAPGIRIIKADGDLGRLPPIPARKPDPFFAHGFTGVLNDLRYLKEFLS